MEYRQVVEHMARSDAAWAVDTPADYHTDARMSSYRDDEVG